MQYQINQTPITQLMQLIHAAELSREKEVRIPIASARLISIALAELFEKLSQDYETLLESLASNNETISITMDGGALSD
jgi:hypothetical protein